MDEDDTTSSSRIFVKIMMQEVPEGMGLPTLKERFSDPEIKGLCTGMFPLDNPKKHALPYQLLYKCRTWCAYYGEHLKVSRAFNVCSLQI